MRKDSSMLTYKNQILIITAIIFIFTITFYNIYMVHQKNSFIESNMEHYNTEILAKYSAIKRNISSTLSRKIKSLIRTKEKHIYDIFDKTVDKKEVDSVINEHFMELKKEFKGLHTIHIYDKNGVSIQRAHNQDLYGNDLKNFRPFVRELVKRPQSASFFENGRYGLIFRVVEPVYRDENILGFIEFGIHPNVFMQRLNALQGIHSYLFIKKELFAQIDTKLTAINTQFNFGDFKFFNISKIDTNFLEQIPNSYTLEDDTKFKINKKIVMAHTLNIRVSSGNIIGKLLFFQDFTKIEKQYREFMFFSLLVSLILIVTLLYGLNRSYSTITNRMLRYTATLDKIKDSIFVIDIKTHTLKFANESAQNSLGYTKKELLGLTLEQFSMSLNGTEELISQEKIDEIKSTNSNYITRAYNRSKDGVNTPVELSFSYVKLEKNYQYLVAICHDITKQLEAEQNDIANKAMINRYVPISHTDLEGNITYVNDAFCSLTGYEKEELIGRNHNILRHPDTKISLYENLWEKIENNESWSGILRNIIKDESVIWTQVKIEPIFNPCNKKLGYISSREDISDKKELEYMSDHDLLTKAKNRRSFEREIEKHIKKAHRFEDKESDFGLVMFDIDLFKSVNDTYGHHAGDMVLTNLSEAIHLNIRDSDIFARWGGEEFIILSPHSNIDNLVEFVKKLQSAIKRTNFLPIPEITVSFGITVFNKNDTTDTIGKRVDDALYKAKNNGRNRYEIL